MKPLCSPLRLLPAGQVKKSWAQSRPEARCRYQWLQARKALSLLGLRQHKHGHPHEERSLGDKQQEPGNAPHPACFPGGVQTLLRSLLRQPTLVRPAGAPQLSGNERPEREAS